MGLIPGWGAKIPHAWQPKNKNKTWNRSNTVTNSIKTGEGVKMALIKRENKLWKKKWEADTAAPSSAPPEAQYPSVGFQRYSLGPHWFCHEQGSPRTTLWCPLVMVIPLTSYLPLGRPQMVSLPSLAARKTPKPWVWGHSWVLGSRAREARPKACRTGGGHLGLESQHPVPQSGLGALLKGSQNLLPTRKLGPLKGSVPPEGSSLHLLTPRHHLPPPPPPEMERWLPPRQPLSLESLLPGTLSPQLGHKGTWHTYSQPRAATEGVPMTPSWLFSRLAPPAPSPVLFQASTPTQSPGSSVWPPEVLASSWGSLHNWTPSLGRCDWAQLPLLAPPCDCSGRSSGSLTTRKMPIIWIPPAFSR